MNEEGVFEEAWVEWGAEDGHWPQRDLLQLYNTLQNRQASDLGLLYRYANYYSAILGALLTAYTIGVVSYHARPGAPLLVILPTASILLAHMARLSTFRLYRRYLEGSVRLNKIEHLLGLDGTVAVGWEKRNPRHLWSGDQAFELDRYALRRAKPESTDTDKRSSEYVKRFADEYGLGYAIQRTLAVFHIIAWIGLALLPATLYLLNLGAEEKDAPLLGAAWLQGVVLTVLAAAASAWSLRGSNRIRHKWHHYLVP